VARRSWARFGVEVLTGKMLSPHFSLQEFLFSQTAERMGIINTPNEKQIAAMQALCVNVLEPIRVAAKAPVIILSGFRSPALNVKTPGSSVTSGHMTGEAADIGIIGASPPQVARWLLKRELVWDQLILEFPDQLRPSRGWNHISFRANGKNRQEVKTSTRTKDGDITFTRGLPEWVKNEPAWGP
jgi:zinc D-Ala-D-Ala carboxypeptidase